MSLNGNAPSGLIIPEMPRRTLRIWVLLALLLTPVCLFLAIATKLRASWTRLNTPLPLTTLAVDEGDIDLIVTENGTLESSNNATARCQVEALIGMVGGAQGAMGPGGRPGGMRGNRDSGQGGNQAGGAAGGMGGPSGQGGQNPQQTQPQPKTQGAAKGKVGAGAGAGGDAAAGGANAAAGGDDTATSPPGGANPGPKKPTIRSFTSEVEPHVPLRPKPPSQPVQQPKAPVIDPALGGGGSGRRGGGSGGDMMQEKPGSTRIISLLPEGTRVQAGDVVCVLDSAAFRDELKAQRIRFIQAKAWVEQARALLEVNEITLREYRDGIYPQDQQLIRQYISTCRVDYERAKRNYAWSEQTTRNGFRSSSQLKADALVLQQAEIKLREAEGMSERLDKYTAPKIIKALEAKIKAILADKLAQESTFELESDRLKRLESTVAHCTIRSPRDGVVVYAQQANRWGRVENPIQEGVTVREGQAIFNVPDPNHMQVRAKVNESKVALIQSGQPVLIRIDAFPDRPLRGIVTEITPIPAPGTPAADIRVYFAVVKIDAGGFDGLRPGLSAEVTFRVESKQHVTLVPLQAVRWVGSRAFAAVEARPETESRPEPPWRWEPIALGLSDTDRAEVIAGLKPGDRVVANPEALPAPAPGPDPPRARTSPARAARPRASPDGDWERGVRG